MAKECVANLQVKDRQDSDHNVKLYWSEEEGKDGEMRSVY